MAGHFVASLLAFIPHSPPTQCTVFRKKEREKTCIFCLSLQCSELVVLSSQMTVTCLTEIIDGNNNEVGIT